jgi:Mn-containing catalase
MSTSEATLRQRREPKSVCERLINFTTGAEKKDALQFLVTREITHKCSQAGGAMARERDDRLQPTRAR